MKYYTVDIDFLLLSGTGTMFYEYKVFFAGTHLICYVALAFLLLTTIFGMLIIILILLLPSVFTKKLMKNRKA